MTFEPAPRARMSPAVRAALREHYLMRCRPESPGDSRDKRVSWSCVCRADLGVADDDRTAHRLFEGHLRAVRILAEDGSP